MVACPSSSGGLLLSARSHAAEKPHRFRNGLAVRDVSPLTPALPESVRDKLPSSGGESTPCAYRHTSEIPRFASERREPRFFLGNYCATAAVDAQDDIFEGLSLDSQVSFQCNRGLPLELAAPAVV